MCRCVLVRAFLTGARHAPPTTRMNEKESLIPWCRNPRHDISGCRHILDAGPKCQPFVVIKLLALEKHLHIFCDLLFCNCVHLLIQNKIIFGFYFLCIKNILFLECQIWVFFNEESTKNMFKHWTKQIFKNIRPHFM
jgi:hypothetical protein